MPEVISPELLAERPVRLASGTGLCAVRMIELVTFPRFGCVQKILHPNLFFLPSLRFRLILQGPVPRGCSPPALPRFSLGIQPAGSEISLVQLGRAKVGKS